MPKPTDRAIAQAFRETQRYPWTTADEFEADVLARAREIDAAAPAGAQAPVAEVARGEYGEATVDLIGDAAELPPGTKLYTAPPAASEDAALPFVIHDVPARFPGIWLGVETKPERSLADETGAITGLALFFAAPRDGGPKIRQGYYDTCLRRFIDSTTATCIGDPDLWSFVPTIDAARGSEES